VAKASASAADRDHEYSALRINRLGTLGLLLVRLGLVFLLIVEHFSNTSQVTIDDEGITDRTRQVEA
jgi:hypothetical protein